MGENGTFSTGGPTVGELPAFEVDFSAQNFQQMPLNQLQMAIMPVVVVAERAMVCAGTAFNVANFGLMMTARHVIDHAIELQRGTPGSWIGVQYVGPSAGQDVPDLLGGPMPISSASINAALDLALLQHPLPHDGAGPMPLKLPALPLRPRLPAVGAEVIALGYNLFDFEFDGMDSSRVVMAGQQEFAVARGQVTEVFPSCRDSAMLHFPSFQTDARYDAGMSGGPVIDVRTGRVVGVVCSSYEGESDSTGYVSFASALAPAFALEVLAEVDGISRQWRLLEFANLGLVPVDGTITDLQTLDHPDGRVTVTYR